MGLALGLGMIAFLEYRDNSFRTDDEVVTLLALPVVATIPLMLSTSERRRQRIRSLAFGVGITIVLLAAAASAVWFFWSRMM